MKLKKIIGKKVVAIKTYCDNRRKKKGFVPDYILFDDKKTIMKFDEQDYYSYHDCSLSARNISIIEDSEFWNRIMKDKSYRDSNEDF